MPDIGDIDNADSVNKSQDAIFHSFLKDHPLSHSLHVTLLNDDQEYVPNFIGEAIPRSNCGDREFYCSTILAFFKPWRSGKDLKLEDQSWDDAFTTHLFNARQLEIICSL